MRVSWNVPVPIAVAIAVAIAFAGLAHAVDAQPASVRVTASEIDAHLRFLSSDLLEGRAPAARGGALATEYIADVLESAGVQPGADGSYFQRVPMDVVTADRQHLWAATTGKATLTLRDPDDIVVWAGSPTTSSIARGEIVFVGYGIDAPEYEWDDFKNIDVRGKVLLELVNNPPATASEPGLFDGGAMTYYGRWTYKFEEAERRGAAGVLLIHTTESAGYPWHTVVASWDNSQRVAPRDLSMPPPLGVRGWITDSAAATLLSQAGLDLSVLRARASLRDFQPLPTGIVAHIRFTNRVEEKQTRNVVGLVRGRDPTLVPQCVVFSAHWDHLGIGPPVNGDSIYNGAEDNASGVADLLAMARVAAASPPPRRSLLFVLTSAEESGLLGSAYFVAHPPVPLADIVADLNIDGGNLMGRVRDLDVLGADKSSLGPELARYVSSRGLRVAPQEHREEGHFYRSDHFSFARAGVPALSIGAGGDFIGHPADWGQQAGDDYAAHWYHQPSDAYRPDFDLRGAVQLSEIVLGFGMALANDRGMPTWNRDAEFQRSTGAAAAQP